MKYSDFDHCKCDNCKNGISYNEKTIQWTDAKFDDGVYFESFILCPLCDSKIHIDYVLDYKFGEEDE